MAHRFFGLISTLLLYAFVTMASVNAQVFLPGSGEKAVEPAAMEKVLEEARQSGSTIIMISPGDDGTKADDDSSMRAEQFLKARERLRTILASAPTLIPNTVKTLQAASPDGTSFWIWRALLTALGGIFVGWLIAQPIQNWVREHARGMYDPEPDSIADKMKYLLFRALMAVLYAGLYFVVAFIVAVIFDPVDEPSRRLIFETILAYCSYRLLRYAISWNLYAYDVPSHRMVNLSDSQASRLHWHWVITSIIAVFIMGSSRFVSITGAEQLQAGMTGTMTLENVLLLRIVAGALMVLLVTIYTVLNWTAWQDAFTPKVVDTPMKRLWRVLARLTPLLWLLYSYVAFFYFMILTATQQPAPVAALAAPYVALWGGAVAYGLAMIAIQAFYNRRERVYRERAAAAHAERQAILAKAKADAGFDEEAGEVMVEPESEVQFEFQPIFRSFFEQGALAIILVVAFGEIGRAWNPDMPLQGTWWSSLLDMVLATVLCWLAYRAISLFIDRRLEEEGGVPEQDEEAGGEGGGAGATRMATLLPIFRYVMMITLLFVGGMIVLSQLGFDIAPIFAGAGVVGIAVGFGAQTLIRDIFSGAFFLMDDAFRKGEYVEIGATKGVVEKISVRSFQLRHHLGALHTIPFGEITQLTNYSRDWVMMKLPLRVTYDTDVEKVRKLVKKLGQRLLDHPQIGHTFMQPLKSQGVYKMEDSAMIIRVKFMTKPGEQFVTRKVVYESIQDLFAREGIKFAHKEVTVRLADEHADDLSEQEKKAVTAAARSVIDAEAEAATGKPVESDR